MARKAYSEQEREQVRIALLTTMLQCIVDRGLIHSSIDVLCKQVGISKTFFYTFFPSKEELVLEALRYQQPKLLHYARRLMEDSTLNWQESVRTFWRPAYMVRKKASPYFPSKRNRRFTAAFLKKISKPSVTTRPNYSAICWRFSVFLPTTSTHDYLATCRCR